MDTKNNKQGVGIDKRVATLIQRYTNKARRYKEDLQLNSSTPNQLTKESKSCVVQVVSQPVDVQPCLEKRQTKKYLNQANRYEYHQNYQQLKKEAIQHLNADDRAWFQKGERAKHCEIQRNYQQRKKESIQRLNSDEQDRFRKEEQATWRRATRRYQMKQRAQKALKLSSNASTQLTEGSKGVEVSVSASTHTQENRKCYSTDCSRPAVSQSFFSLPRTPEANVANTGVQLPPFHLAFSKDWQMFFPWDSLCLFRPLDLKTETKNVP